MLKIGDIASFCRISIKALRHYNKIKLFQPNYIDSVTGYRYYSEDQIKRLVFIIDLKEIGFSLREIHYLLENNDPETFLELLAKKRMEAEDKIRLEQLRIENMDSIREKIQAERVVSRQVIKSPEEPSFDPKIARLVTIDSCASDERHAIEEAVWV